MFDAYVEASRKPDSEPAKEKYEDFVEVGHGLLVPTVLRCIVENAGKASNKEFNVEERLEKIVEKLTQERIWSKTSPLKKREKEIKALMNRCVTQGKLANETQKKLLRIFLSKFYTYANGIIAVS